MLPAINTQATDSALCYFSETLSSRTSKKGCVLGVNLRSLAATKSVVGGLHLHSLQTPSSHLKSANQRLPKSGRPILSRKLLFVHLRGALLLLVNYPKAKSPVTHIA